MAFAEQGDQQLANNTVLADDDFAEFVADPAVNFSQFLERGDGFVGRRGRGICGH